MAFRFIHTADWQLGRQFSGIGGDAGAALRDRRVEAVREIGELATRRGVDAILVAGDAFDDNAVAFATLIRTRDALKTFAGDWVFIPGNHDPALSASAWTRLADLADRDPPGNVHFLIEPGAPLCLCDGATVVLPAVLQRRHEVDDLTAWFDDAETPAGAIRVGLAHGSVRERLPNPSEVSNPIAADRAESARLDYLALGDWHGMLRIDDRTWYSGTPEADRFTSRDPGNVLLVSIDGPGRTPRVEPLRVGRFTWRSVDRKVRAGADVEALDDRLRSLVHDPATCLLSLTVSGAVDLAAHAELRTLLEEWKARLRFLRVDDAALLARPSDRDLDRIDRAGFVRDAVERLRVLASDAHDPDRAIAEAALVRLYEEHVKAETRKGEG